MSVRGYQDVFAIGDRVEIKLGDNKWHSGILIGTRGPWMRVSYGSTGAIIYEIAPLYMRKAGSKRRGPRHESAKPVRIR